MSWVPAEQVLQTVQTQRQILDAEQARIAQATQAHAADRQKLEAERAQAAHNLGQAILPSLDARHIAIAAERTGLLGLPGEDLPGKREARRAWLAARLTEISRDERFVHRELLRHPRTGSLMTAIAEAEEMRKPAHEIITTCEAHPRFAKLWNEDFGTPEQKTSWWRFSYWSDRSAANELLALLPGKTTFAELREEYRVSCETRATYDVELARLRAEVAAGDALNREYAALYDEWTNLDQRALEHTRARIVQHLLGSDVPLVSQRLAAHSALRQLFLRASGIAAKITYLEGIQRQNLGELQKELGAQRQKLDTVEARTRRRFAPMPLDKYQKLAEDRRPRWQKRWDRHDKVYTTVHSFNRWDRGSRFEELLWWDVMTRGRYDGSYIHEVSSFHHHHPSYSFDPEDLKGSNAEFFANEDSAGELASDYQDAAAASAFAESGSGERGDSLETTDAS